MTCTTKPGLVPGSSKGQQVSWCSTGSGFAPVKVEPRASWLTLSGARLGAVLPPGHPPSIRTCLGWTSMFGGCGCA